MDRKLTMGHVGRGTGRVAPFDAIYKGERLCRTEEDFDHIDALVIWGGADISPSIYGEPVGPRTGATEELTMGDKIEVWACEHAIERGIPIIGICRGAQLACAMAGGILVQDVSGHGGDHPITTDTGRVLTTSSVHHQMMYPWEVDHTMIAWASTPRSKDYVGVDANVIKVEPEIVYFPKIKALAIQGHPEFMHPKDEFVIYCLDLVRKYLLGEDYGS